MASDHRGVKPDHSLARRQNRDAPPCLADHGADAAKWCAWKEMTRELPRFLQFNHVNFPGVNCALSVMT